MYYNKSEKTFDRGVGFMFFGTFYEKGKAIGEAEGGEKELAFYRALIEYGLFKKEPSKEMKILTLSEIKEIDRSQKRRQASYAPASISEATVNTILDCKSQHTDYTQSQIADECNVSQSTVSKALAKKSNDTEAKSNVIQSDISKSASNKGDEPEVKKTDPFDIFKFSGSVFD